VIKEKNIASNSMSKVIHNHFKPLEYIADPYERKDEFEAQQKHLSKEKMLGEKRFRSMSHGNILLTSNKKLFETDGKMKELMSSKNPFLETPPKVFSHESKFKLVRKGHGESIGKYP
jgi:hypothetical protein